MNDDWTELEIPSVEDLQVHHFAVELLEKYVRIFPKPREAAEATVDHLVRVFPKEKRPALEEVVRGIQGVRTAAPKEQWVYVRGIVKIGTQELHELARQACEAAGLDQTTTARISNLVARGQVPPDQNVAAGTILQGRPHIWMSTTDRNAIMDAVLYAMKSRTAMSLSPEALAKYPKRIVSDDLPKFIPGFDFFPTSTLPEGAPMTLQVVPLSLMGTGTQPDLETYNQGGEYWDQWKQRPEGYHVELQQAIDQAADIPPIVLVTSKYEPGRYDIADGWHRSSLARNLGLTEFPAYVYNPSAALGV